MEDPFHQPITLRRTGDEIHIVSDSINETLFLNLKQKPSAVHVNQQHLLLKGSRQGSFPSIFLCSWIIPFMNNVQVLFCSGLSSGKTLGFLVCWKQSVLGKHVHNIIEELLIYPSLKHMSPYRNLVVHFIPYVSPACILLQIQFNFGSWLHYTAFNFYSKNKIWTKCTFLIHACCDWLID